MTTSLAWGNSCPEPTEAAAARLRDEVGELKREAKWPEAALKAACLAEIADKVFGPLHPTTVNLLGDIEEVFRAAGLADKGAAVAEQIARAAPKSEPPETSQTRSVIARIKLLAVRGKSLLDRGDRQGAGRACQEARYLAKVQNLEVHIIFAVVLNECGRVYEALGDYPSAEERYRQSAELARKIEGSRSRHLSVALNNLGLLYVNTERSEQALVTLHEALEITGSDNVESVPIATNLGLALERTGHTDEARSMFLSARDLLVATYGDLHEHLIPILSNLAAHEWRRGHLLQAVEWQEQAHNVSERNVLSVIRLGSERQKLAYMAKFEDLADASVSLSLAWPVPQLRSGEMAFQAVLQRKGRVLSAYAASLERVRRESDAANAQLLSAFAEEQRRRAHVYLGTTPPTRQDDPIADREQFEELVGRAASVDAALGDLTRSVTLAQVRSALPPRTTLIEYVLYKPKKPARAHFVTALPRYAVFVLRDTGELAWRDLGEQRAIDTAVSDLREGAICRS